MDAEVKKEVPSFQDIIEELKRRETEKKHITININIQEIKEINIQEFYLDQLSYHLDRLDIKDLSGALNLGNNFGGRVVKGIEKSKPKASFSVVVNGKNIPFKVIDYYQ
ncbi:hypothetical protein DS745_02780 [Anaerobacillus alkaliphilus]|uniref:Uncharacterized protein n=1 Tax=Anaerobacillus alkaliphilus TaxID=1548597 RepID=A0A4Q0VYT6_9BACI|nr:hypothetical protein [Anaerobacillus alkaliphilus]RXJ04326.1 hypothetical protein DS745_02780 [Anaerobacillus alkaliphilus]